MTDKTLTLAVAGAPLLLALPHADWADLARQRYAEFLSAAQPAWAVTVRDDPTQPLEDPGWVRHEGDITHFRVRQHHGAIDLASRTAWVTAPSLERLASALERTLTYILMQTLPRERVAGDGALLLHACGVIIGDRGYVFFGPSGAGKTTVARLAQGYAEVLCDENVVLRVAERGVELVSTPFWGFSTPPDLIRRTNRSAPLAGLYSLVHSPQFSLAPMTPGHAVAALLDTEKVATERTESAAAWLDVAGRIVERIPVHTLGFPPTTELWSFLLRHENN